MAFGNYSGFNTTSKGSTSYNTENKKSNNSTELTVYSSYSFVNSESEGQKSSLSFYFWNGLLAMSINPLIKDNEHSTPSDIRYKRDKENSVSIYLSVPKALMFSKQIDAFMKHEIDEIGISSRVAYVTITRTSDDVIVNITKVDDTGNMTDHASYELRKEYYYGITNINEVKGSLKSYDKQYFPEVEIELIKTQLDEYVKAMTYATSYAVNEQNFRRANRMEYKINKISEAVGITNDSGDNGGYRRNASSFFDANRSIDDNLVDEDSDLE